MINVLKLSYMNISDKTVIVVKLIDMEVRNIWKTIRNNLSSSW